MNGLAFDVSSSPCAGAHVGGPVGDHLLGVVGRLAVVEGVANEYNEVIHIEGMVEGVKGCIDVEDTTGYSRASCPRIRALL